MARWLTVSVIGWPSLDGRGGGHARREGRALGLVVDEAGAALLVGLLGGAHRVARDRRRVDAEQHVHLGAELLDHGRDRRDGREIGVATERGVVEVGRPDAEDHAAALVGRQALARRRRQREPCELDVAAGDLGLDEVHRGRADERRHEQVDRELEEVLRRVALLQHAVAHDRHAVSERHRLDLIVRDVDGRRLEPVAQARELGAHLHAQLGVEVRERLVHQEGARLAHHRAPHRDALPLAARERRRLALEQRIEAEDVRDVVDAALDLDLRRLAQLEPEAEVLLDRHVRVERVVLEHHRDVAILRRQIGHDSVADRDLTVGDLLEPGHHAQDRRLATPGRADEDHELAVADLERDVVDRLHAARKDLADAVECDTSHARTPNQSRCPEGHDHIRAEAPAASASRPCQSRSRSSAVSCVRARRCVARTWRSHQKRPVTWAGSSAAASQTMVSAPCSGVRSSGPHDALEAWEGGLDPGRVGPSRVHRMHDDPRARELCGPALGEHHLGTLACARRRRARRTCPGATAGRRRPGDACTCRRRTRTARAPARSRSGARAGGASAGAARARSSRTSAPPPPRSRAAPSAARRRCARARARARRPPAGARRRRARSGATRCRRARSGRRRCPSRSTIRRRAVSPRAASRTSSRSDAPSRAIPRLAASPSPPLAPVTRHTRPSRRGGSPQCSTRPRSSGPMREKPPITLASSVASTSPASLPRGVMRTPYPRATAAENAAEGAADARALRR